MTRSAFGGEGWAPREKSHSQEIGDLWRGCGIRSEVEPLCAVLLHAPGDEISSIADPDAIQWLAPMDPLRARAQHDDLMRGYEDAGVVVHLMHPDGPVPPNLLFMADLFWMTPEGAIVCRTASTIRAGEERIVARKLADLGIPILRTIHGDGHFEGADAMWLDCSTVLLAEGLRTNREGANQVATTLSELGINVVGTRLAPESMHLMGQLRILDNDLAMAWVSRLEPSTIEALEDHGSRVLDIPDEQEAREGFALNFVTLGPRKVLMPGPNPRTQALLEAEGVECITVTIDELTKGAGGIGCMTGILERGG